MFLAIEIDIGAVYELYAAGGGVVAREIPVAGTAWNGVVEAVERLKQDFDARVDVVGAKHGGLRQQSRCRRIGRI